MNDVRIRTNTCKNILRSRLTIFNPNENDTGIYWCQIVSLQENGQRGRALEPSQETLVEDPHKYDGLPPCPFTALHDATTACADDRGRVAQSDPTTPLTPDPSVVTPSISQPVSPVSCALPTPLASPAVNCDDNQSPMRASTGIPSWGYGLLIGGAAVGILATSVCVVFIVVQRKKRPPSKFRRPHKGEVTSLLQGAKLNFCHKQIANLAC